LRALEGQSSQATSRIDDILERIRHKKHLGRRVTAPRQRSRAAWMAGIALGVAAGTALLSGATDFTGGELREGYANLLAPKQDSERTLGINIAPTVYAEPMSPWPMPVLVRGGGELPASTALHVRGLPVSATLSEGRRTAGTRGASSEPSEVTGSDRRLAETMVARGERELSQGNVSGARQFLLRAAETGLARAALLLGSTYDQHEFARLHIQGCNQTRAWRANGIGVRRSWARQKPAPRCFDLAFLIDESRSARSSWM
jgi:hypothetical protein